uniref:Uncharacterized protein n=1 Tax=Amphiprion percula TaxID=161767 RepID=A0A3P8T0I0_AMPPE
MLLADKVINCGYTSQIKLDSKENIIRAIVLHSTTRLITMFQQMRKGMELYGLVNQMAFNSLCSCRQSRCSGLCYYIFINFNTNYFCQELEISVEESHSLGVQHVLQWLTGQSHIPILPDEKRHFKITCMFDHDCRERLGDHSICDHTQL